MKSWLRLGVVCAALGLGACGGLISNTKEVEIGTGVDREIEGQFKIAAEDDPISGWARDLVGPLSQASVQTSPRGTASADLPALTGLGSPLRKLLCRGQLG